ncbi:p80 [Scenedesmus sp. PABB004]|nr:p80 [Scenedesmus sp. PABB004]
MQCGAAGAARCCRQGHRAPVGVRAMAPARRPARGRPAAASGGDAAVAVGGEPAAASDYAALRGVKVLSAADGFETELLSLWAPGPDTTVVLPFLTHFADLTSWEYAQKLRQKVLPVMRERGVQVITVGLGSADNARAFAAALDYPLDGLYADPTGACYAAQGFSPGFLPGAAVSPVLKLLPMLAGIGSPGTLREVIRGYVGDRSAGPVFEAARPNPFDILGTGYQRPFELATLRLMNMVGILPKWGELSPPNSELLVQQGGTLVLRGRSTVFKHVDSGILKYTDVGALLAAVDGAAAQREAIARPAGRALPANLGAMARRAGLAALCTLVALLVALAAPALAQHSGMDHGRGTPAAAAAAAPANVSDPCITAPSAPSCADFKYPHAAAVADLATLCGAMHFMAACSVARACNASGAGPDNPTGPGAANVSEENPDVCRPFNLVATVCRHDTGMSKMRGCANYNAMCANGSVVGMCRNLTGLDTLPTTRTLNDRVRSLCTDMPGHTGCDLCLPSFRANATWGDCDLLAVYGTVCAEMPEMEGCAEWEAMCSADHSPTFCAGHDHDHSNHTADAAAPAAPKAAASGAPAARVGALALLAAAAGAAALLL